MIRLSRQTIGFDTTSLVTIVYLLFYFLIFYWFYSILKRIEKTLSDIKKILESKPSTAN